MHGFTQPPGFRETVDLIAYPDLLMIAIKATQLELDVCDRPCALDPDSDCHGQCSDDSYRRTDGQPAEEAASR